MDFSGLMSVESLKLGLLTIVSYFIYVYLLRPALHFVHRAIHYHGFPCYPKNFLFGHSLLFWTNFPFPYNLESIQTKFHETTNKMAAYDQDQSTTVCWISLNPTVLPVSHEAVEVIMNKTNVKKQYFYKFMGLGNGLVASEPALWKVRRKMIEPFFSTKKIKGYAKHMDQEVKSFTQQLYEETVKPVDLEDQIHSSTLNIILKSAISIPLDDSVEDKNSLTELINKVEPNLVKRSLNPLYYIDWVAKFTKFGRYYFETLDSVEKILKKMLIRRKQLLSLTSNESENQDFVSLLEGKVDQQGFFDELITMIGAGHETTAVGLRWILFNLGHHPDVQERLYQEIIQFFPDDTLVDDMDKINQCNYLDQCIKESLRLNPPIHLFARELEEDIMVKDKKLLKDSRTLVCCPIIHRNPNVYPDPDKYDPDRWTPENASKIPKAAYIPFGYGPRSCIGYRYAILELKIYTIQIIRKFSLRSTRKHESIPSKFEITLKPCLPLEIIVTPRNNN